MKPVIPFHKPFTDKREQESITNVFETGILRGDGPQSKEVQTLIREITGARHVFFTTSCTHALEIAILALDLKPGDEVIMPSFTFVSTANAVMLHGGIPIFCDIQPGTLNIDPDDVLRKITSKTRAIVPVHYAGVAADLHALMHIANKHNIMVIEDAAQGADAYYFGKHLGTIGHMGCLSFHDTKNITCGEGGAFLTNDDTIARKAEIIREKGTNRSAFLRGEVDKYTWINRGSSFIQSDILAAVLKVQWQKRDEIRQRREKVWMAYHQALEIFEHNGHIRRPILPESCTSNFHTYFFTTNSAKVQDDLLQLFKSQGITASFHYIPLHSSPFGRKITDVTVELPITDNLSQCLIRLPLYPAILEEHPDFCERVTDVLTSYYN